MIFDSLVLGVAGAGAAYLFVFLLKAAEHFFYIVLPGLIEAGGVIQNPMYESITLARGVWWIPVITTLGGLLTGLIVYTLAPESEGHGTDTAVQAFHRFGGYVRTRVPWIKMVASALTIGSGGAAGREGPTVLISAGLGSIYARWLKRSDAQRRQLVLIGMAAGLSAIFHSPIGAAFFAIEVLYRDVEFEGGALIYTLLASVEAYALIGLATGWEPLFHVPAKIPAPTLTENLWYIPLGLVCGMFAVILPIMLYRTRSMFRRMPVPNVFKPAVGGFLLGLIAVFSPQILGGGYDWIQKAVDGNLSGSVLLLLIFMKILAFSLTIGSGGSGGVFAPSLFVGAMLAGFLGRMTGQSPTGFVIVGMAALFGGAARAPIAALLMVTEMTGGYHFLVPAALAVALSYLVSELAFPNRKDKSLYEAQVPRRSDSPAHHVEHIQTALEIMHQEPLKVRDAVGHLDAIALLQSGVPIDLPGDQKIFIGRLRTDSPCVRKPIRENCLHYEKDKGHPNIVAVVRGREVLIPRPELVLMGGDQVVLIAPEGKWPELRKKHFETIVETPPDSH